MSYPPLPPPDEPGQAAALPPWSVPAGGTPADATSVSPHNAWTSAYGRNGPGVPGYGPPGYLLPGYRPSHYPPTVSAPRRDNRAFGIVLGAVLAAALLCAGGITVTWLTLTGDHQAVTAAPAPSANRPALEPAPAAPRSMPASSPSPVTVSTGNAGDTLLLRGRGGDQVKVVIANAKARTSGCDTYALEPDHGGWVTVDVTIEVVNGPAEISPYAFELLTPDGRHEGNTASGASGCGTDLPSVGGARTGDKHSGQLVFDASEAKGTVDFRSLSGAAGSWTL